MTKIKLLLYFLAILIFLKGCEVVPFGDWSNPVDSLNTDELVLSEVKNLFGTPGNREVILTWSNPEDDNFDHVEIWYGIGNTDTEYLGIIDSAGTTISGLTDNTEYSFKIKAVDISNNYKSDGIDISISTLNTLAPGEVRDLNIVLGDSQITLSWINPTDPDFDHIEIWYGIGNTDTEYTGDKIPTGTRITELTNNKTYNLKILTVDSEGNKSQGNIITFSISHNMGLTIIVTTPWDEILTFNQSENITVDQNETLTVSINEVFDSYFWELYSVDLSGETGSSININCLDLEPGVHMLYAITSKNGILFSECIKFIVQN